LKGGKDYIGEKITSYKKSKGNQIHFSQYKNNFESERKKNIRLISKFEESFRNMNNEKRDKKLELVYEALKLSAKIDADLSHSERAKAMVAKLIALHNQQNQI